MRLRSASWYVFSILRHGVPGAFTVAVVAAVAWEKFWSELIYDIYFCFGGGGRGGVSFTATSWQSRRALHTLRRSPRLKSSTVNT